MRKKYGNWKKSREAWKEYKKSKKCKRVISLAKGKIEGMCKRFK